MNAYLVLIITLFMLSHATSQGSSYSIEYGNGDNGYGMTRTFRYSNSQSSNGMTMGTMPESLPFISHQSFPQVSPVFSSPVQRNSFITQGPNFRTIEHNYGTPGSNYRTIEHNSNSGTPDGSWSKTTSYRNSYSYGFEPRYNFGNNYNDDETDGIRTLPLNNNIHRLNSKPSQANDYFSESNYHIGNNDGIEDKLFSSRDNRPLNSSPSQTQTTMPTMLNRGDYKSRANPTVGNKDPIEISGSIDNLSQLQNVTSIEIACGKVAIRITPRIIGGEPTFEGDWPWHGALFQTQDIGSSIYKCGGSLLSRNHFITAAHCVSSRGSAFNHQSLIVYLGKYNLKFWNEHVQTKSVKQVILHPDFNYTHYQADLAILKFSTPVDYTDYVRPVCLWKDTETDISSVIDRRGSVVGWGYNRNNVLREELTLVEMPVVNDTTCIFSYREFFSRFVSNVNYCAAYNEGSVCNGDSGGGMVFTDSDNKTPPTWRLRGIVSVTVPKANENMCDIKHYVIFTDTAKFLPWIKNKISKS